jgi:hypothetical protein
MKTFSFAKTVIISLGILCQTIRPVLAQLQVEQVQRDYQARYHYVTGRYLQWPECGDGQTPAPQFPKNGFYGDLTQDPDKGVEVVSNLVQNFYWASPIYASFVKATNYNDLQGASTIATYSAADLQPIPQASDVNASNYMDLLSTIAAHLAGMNFFRVQASQLTSIADTKVSYSRADCGGSACNCVSVQGCVTNNHASTSWGTMAFYDPVLGCAQGQVSSATQYTRISVVYDSGSFVGRAQAAARNARGRITADLTAYASGKASIYLQLTRPNCSDAFWAQYSVSACSNHFDLTPPTSAPENTYGLWTNGLLHLGTVSTSDYVTYSDQLPATPSACMTTINDVHGWAVNGAVVIVAPDFTTIPDPQDCCSCTLCDAGSPAFDLQSIHVNIPLGSDNFGGSAGALTLATDQPSPGLATPSALRYSVAATVEVVTNAPGPGQRLQFKTSQVLADITTNNAYSYTLSFYNAPDAGTKDGSGFYQPTGTAFTTILVENPDASPTTYNRLRFTTTTGGNSTVTEYDYNTFAAQWQLTTGNGLRQDTRASVWDPTSVFRTETVTITNSNNHLVYKEVSTYQLFPWGQERIQNIVDPDNAALTSIWTFYTNAATDGGNYRQLRQQIDSSGRWTQYQYDQNGRETNRITQFLNSPPGSTSASNRFTATFYSTNEPQITVIESLLGTEVSRRYTIVRSGEVDDIQCQTRGALVSAPDNLITITRKYTNGSFAGQLRSVQHPDGTVQLYSYQTNATQKATIILSGVQDPTSDTNIVSGTVTTTITMLGGQILTNTVLYRSPGLADILTDQDYYTYTDSRNRSYIVTHLDGTTDQYNYACCGLDTKTDRDGTTTQYFYDALKRQVASLRNGITASNWLEANGASLGTFRIGTDTSSISLQRQTYDIAGRLRFETNALNGASIHTNYFDSSNQLVKQTTYPDGGTRIETYFQDGSLHSVTGTAVQPLDYLYGVDSDGAFTVERRLDASGGTNE